MKTRLVRIGKSQGILLPEAIIEEAGLKDEVDVHLCQGAVVIMPAGPRAGWADAARRMREAGEDALLDASSIR